MGSIRQSDCRIVQPSTANRWETGSIPPRLPDAFRILMGFPIVMIFLLPGVDRRALTGTAWTGAALEVAGIRIRAACIGLTGLTGPGAETAIARFSARCPMSATDVEGTGGGALRFSATGTTGAVIASGICVVANRLSIAGLAGIADVERTGRETDATAAG